MLQVIVATVEERISFAGPDEVAETKARVIAEIEESEQKIVIFKGLLEKVEARETELKAEAAAE